MDDLTKKGAPEVENTVEADVTPANGDDVVLEDDTPATEDVIETTDEPITAEINEPTPELTLESLNAKLDELLELISKLAIKPPVDGDMALDNSLNAALTGDVVETNAPDLNALSNIERELLFPETQAKTDDDVLALF